jgi:4-amino-4-deoxy-L-arabinose transferase-like glycosyltransferase
MPLTIESDNTVLGSLDHGGREKSFRQPRLGVLLCLIVAASFVIRITALVHWGTGAIESEGAEYTTIAENLRNGVGYVGLVSPGPQLTFPPLFPLLIAAASLATRNFEWAGRLVSLVLGGLLPLPVFGIASRLFNRNVGFIAAIFVVVHPLLVNLSFSVLSEAPYTTVFLTAVYAVVWALNQSSVKPWLVVGGVFGLAYLTRQEAVAAMLLAALFALVATKGGLVPRGKRALAVIAVFFVFALPEVVFIYRETGKIRLDGKSAQFFALGRRILIAQESASSDHPRPDAQNDRPSPAPSVKSWQPWEEKWAFYAIDDHLNPTGIAVLPHAEVVRETRINLKELVHLVEKGIRLNAPVFVEQLSSRWLGGPFLPALALLGAFRRPWRRGQGSSRLFVLLVAAAPVLATFTALWSQDRYYFVLVPFLIIWAANGLVELGLWTKASSAAAGWMALARPVVSQWIIPGLIGLAIVIYPIKGVRQNYVFMEGAPSTRVEKEVGLWIGHQQNQVRIMDLSIKLAFHADAKWVMFPYCSPDLAIRFLDATKVDYVVLRRGQTFTKYYQEWMTQGIPGSRAELIHISPDADAKFAIYRWHRAG